MADNWNSEKIFEVALRRARVSGERTEAVTLMELKIFAELGGVYPDEVWTERAESYERRETFRRQGDGTYLGETGGERLYRLGDLLTVLGEEEFRYFDKLSPCPFCSTLREGVPPAHDGPNATRSPLPGECARVVPMYRVFHLDINDSGLWGAGDPGCLRCGAC